MGGGVRFCRLFCLTRGFIVEAKRCAYGETYESSSYSSSSVKSVLFLNQDTNRLSVSLSCSVVTVVLLLFTSYCFVRSVRTLLLFVRFGLCFENDSVLALCRLIYTYNMLIYNMCSAC